MNDLWTAVVALRWVLAPIVLLLAYVWVAGKRGWL